MSISTFGFPTPIVFGAGARHQVSAHLRERGIRRPLVVTDRGIARASRRGRFSAL